MKQPPTFVTLDITLKSSAVKLVHPQRKLPLISVICDDADEGKLSVARPEHPETK